MLVTMQLAKRTSNFSMILACIVDHGQCDRVGPVPQNRQDGKKEAAHLSVLMSMPNRGMGWYERNQ
jgi:hypothetical protein